MVSSLLRNADNNPGTGKPDLYRQYGYIYDKAGTRTGDQVTSSSETRLHSMKHNAFNQINARSPGGTLMVKGALTQPSKVTVGLSGQASKEAEYPSPNKFRGLCH
jgi:hypothetical protein